MLNHNKIIKNSDLIKQKIFNLIEEFYKIEHQQKKFVPGETYIKYAGRVFDTQELITSVDACLDFWLTNGKYTKKFENLLKDFLKINFATFVNSGSSANLIAVSALKSHLLKKRRLVEGDEIITTATCFPTTVNAIIQNGLVPVFVDVEIETYNAIASKIEKAISSKTKAIILAHTLGIPFDVTGIVSLAKKNGLFLIEDCCDALGSKYNSTNVGTFGDISTFSFYPSHHITTGEGGAIATNDTTLYYAVRSLTNWGKSCWCGSGESNLCGKRFSGKYGLLPIGYDHKYVYSHIGFNVKATDIQAAIGVSQFNKLELFNQKRIENFSMFFKKFFEFKDFFILPNIDECCSPVWFAFPVTLKNNLSFTRAELANFLEGRKIETRVIFAGNITKQPAYLDLKFKISGNLENSDVLMNRSLFFGLYPSITNVEIKYIFECVKEFLSFYK